LSIEIIEDANTIHRLIFTLPVLKYCNTTFQCKNENFVLSNSIGKISPIEYFISKSTCNLKILVFYSGICRVVNIHHPIPVESFDFSEDGSKFESSTTNESQSESFISLSELVRNI